MDGFFTPQIMTLKSKHYQESQGGTPKTAVTKGDFENFSDMASLVSIEDLGQKTKFDKIDSRNKMPQAFSKRISSMSKGLSKFAQFVDDDDSGFDEDQEDVTMNHSPVTFFAVGV